MHSSSTKGIIKKEEKNWKKKKIGENKKKPSGGK
jgi:hypothetical protein